MTSVGIVVPTFNSAKTLRMCLESLRSQTHPCQLVVVDNHSVDETRGIAGEVADHVLVVGPERSAQRNAGAAFLHCEIVGFIDSDMTVSPRVVEEVAAAVGAGAGAVVVPEVTVGTGFWASVRAFERSHYIGDERVEAARFFRADLFQALNGFDEGLDAAEDWDLTIRARAVALVGRTESRIDHHEGRVTYRAACAKKGRYAGGILAFSRKQGTRSLGRLLSRRYLRQPWLLLVPHPLLGAGLVALKSGESLAVGWHLIHHRGWTGAGAARRGRADRAHLR